MKRVERRCQWCFAKALTPPSRRQGVRMRGGFIYRRGHDLCPRCYRVAAAGLRRWAREQRLAA